jgi:hypothetical protein
VLKRQKHDVFDEYNLERTPVRLDDFLRATPLTDSIAALERALKGADRAGAVQAGVPAGITGGRRSCVGPSGAGGV